MSADPQIDKQVAGYDVWLQSAGTTRGRESALELLEEKLEVEAKVAHLRGTLIMLKMRIGYSDPLSRADLVRAIDQALEV